jgi:hypothetical protein
MPEGPVFDGACSSSQATKASVAARASRIAFFSARPLPAVFLASSFRELFLVRARKRECVGPQLDDVVVGGALVVRRVALLRPECQVVRGVARPGLEHPDVEIEAIHLRANECRIDARLDRPAVRVDRLEAAAVRIEFSVPPLEGRRRIVGCAVLERRMLEGAPVRKQLRERLVPGRGGGPGESGWRRDREDGNTSREATDLER